jgi:hypothetical protein
MPQGYRAKLRSEAGHYDHDFPFFETELSFEGQSLFFSRQGGQCSLVQRLRGDGGFSFDLPVRLDPSDTSGLPTHDGPEAVRLFGVALFNQLFPGRALSLLRNGRERAGEQRQGLRLRLTVDAPELSHLPWECLYDHERGVFLALDDCTIVRDFKLEGSRARRGVNPPFRILALAARPNGLSSVDEASERDRMERAFRELEAERVAELRWIRGGTWGEFTAALSRNDPYHVFHFIGHGERGHIIFNDERGDPERVTAEVFAQRLALGHFDLVVLNCCSGAADGSAETLSSVAGQLIRRGVKAVVAMQRQISDASAVAFSREFYRAVASGAPIDYAILIARHEMSRHQGIGWSVPALFLQIRDGVLFDFIDGRERARSVAAKLAGQVLEYHRRGDGAPGAIDLLAEILDVLARNQLTFGDVERFRRAFERLPGVAREGMPPEGAGPEGARQTDNRRSAERGDKGRERAVTLVREKRDWAVSLRFFLLDAQHSPDRRMLRRWVAGATSSDLGSDALTAISSVVIQALQRRAAPDPALDPTSPVRPLFSKGAQKAVEAVQIVLKLRLDSVPLRQLLRTIADEPGNPVLQNLSQKVLGGTDLRSPRAS